MFWILVLILIVILLLFGGSKLPDAGRGLGKAISDFRRSSSEIDKAGPPRRKDGKEEP